MADEILPRRSVLYMPGANERALEKALLHRFGIPPQAAPSMRRVVVAVDPSVGAGAAHNDECGIVVAGLGVDGRAYVLADWSLKARSPSVWAQRAMRAFEKFKADCILAEANQGGEMVRIVLGREGPADRKSTRLNSSH